MLRVPRFFIFFTYSEIWICRSLDINWHEWLSSHHYHHEWLKPYSKYLFGWLMASYWVYFVAAVQVQWAFTDDRLKFVHFVEGTVPIEINGCIFNRFQNVLKNAGVTLTQWIIPSSCWFIITLGGLTKISRLSENTEQLQNLLFSIHLVGIDINEKAGGVAEYWFVNGRRSW